MIDILCTSTRHNSYVRMIETGTEGLEQTQSQPMMDSPL